MCAAMSSGTGLDGGERGVGDDDAADDGGGASRAHPGVYPLPPEARRGLFVFIGGKFSNSEVPTLQTETTTRTLAAAVRTTARFTARPRRGAAAKTTVSRDARSRSDSRGRVERAAFRGGRAPPEHGDASGEDQRASRARGGRRRPPRPRRPRLARSPRKASPEAEGDANRRTRLRFTVGARCASRA